VIPGPPLAQPVLTIVAGQPGLVEPSVSIPNVSFVFRRAFVAGQAVQLRGPAPPPRAPHLHPDRRLLGPPPPGAGGLFDVAVATHDLAPGQHVAEVFCTNPVALLQRTVFWVAAPESGSNVLFVALSSLLVLCALGWVALRTFAGPSMARTPVPSRR